MQPFTSHPAAQPVTIVLDTCVLLSRPVSTLLLGLAQQQYVQPYWSISIKKEWWRHAERLWGWSPQALEQLWAQWQIEHPYAQLGSVQSYTPALKYSDPKDWHVIAAACAAQARSATVQAASSSAPERGSVSTAPQWVSVPQIHAQSSRQTVIVTRNIKDFNRSELRRLGILRQNPDQFLSSLVAAIPVAVWKRLLIEVQHQGIVSMQGAGLRPKTIETVLRQERLFSFNAWLRTESPEILTACAGSFQQLTKGQND